MRQSTSNILEGLDSRSIKRDELMVVVHNKKNLEKNIEDGILKKYKDKLINSFGAKDVEVTVVLTIDSKDELIEDVLMGMSIDINIERPIVTPQRITQTLQKTLRFLKGYSVKRDSNSYYLNLDDSTEIYDMLVTLEKEEKCNIGRLYHTEDYYDASNKAAERDKENKRESQRQNQEFNRDRI